MFETITPSSGSAVSFDRQIAREAGQAGQAGQAEQAMAEALTRRTDHAPLHVIEISKHDLPENSKSRGKDSGYDSGSTHNSGQSSTQGLPAKSTSKHGSEPFASKKLSTHPEEVSEFTTPASTPWTSTILADSSSRIPEPIYDSVDYKTIGKRLQTYTNYTGKVPAILCAKAGFVNTCASELMCPWCKLKIGIGTSQSCADDTNSSSITNVDILAFHRSKSLNCAFFKNIPFLTTESTPNLSPGLSDVRKDKNLKVSQSASGTSVVTVQTDAATPDAGTTGCSQQLDLYNKIKNKSSELAIKEVESRGESFSTQLNHRWHYQKNRQKTFEQLIAKSNSPQWKVFAADGFYLKLDNAGILIMECIFCQLGCKFTLEEAGDTEFKSKVKTNHEQRGCRFILGEKNQPHKNIPDIFEDATWTEKGIDDNNNAAGENNETRLGINFSQAAHPDMAVPDRRKATFLTFPHGSVKQPDELSDSGCFYSGGDSVTCFSCDTKLSNFDHGEDVWTRHVRCSPNCTFIKYHKGQDFINRVLERHGPYVEPRSEPRITNITTRMLRPRIDSPAVAKALSMGLDREDVKTAIGNRIKKGEQDFRWAAEIFRAVNIEKVPTQVLNEASIDLPRVIQEAEASQEEEAEVDVGEEMEVVEELVEKDEVDGITKSERKETEESTMMEKEPTKLAQLIKSQLTCKICLSDIVGIIFIPCGHLVCCTMCSAAMSQCPICRHSINGTIKANF